MATPNAPTTVNQDNGSAPANRLPVAPPVTPTPKTRRDPNAELFARGRAMGIKPNHGVTKTLDGVKHVLAVKELPTSMAREALEALFAQPGKWTYAGEAAGFDTTAGGCTFEAPDMLAQFLAIRDAQSDE